MKKSEMEFFDSMTRIRKIKKLEAEKELKLVVNFCKESIDDIKEIRVFGSYSKRHGWFPIISDIDLFVYTSAEFFESGKHALERKMNSCELKNRYDIFVCNKNSPELEYKGARGSLGKDMKRGRLLYRRGWLNPSYLVEKLITALY